MFRLLFSIVEKVCTRFGSPGLYSEDINFGPIAHTNTATSINRVS